MADTEQPQVQPQEIRFLTSRKALKIEPFRILQNQLQVGRAWKEWLEDFEDEVQYFQKREVRDKVSALKIYGMPEIKKLARNLPAPAPVENDNNFEKIKRKLNNHFLSKKNKHHVLYSFSKQRMEPSETVVSYAARMRHQAGECEFGGQEDERILEHLIQTIRDEELVKRAIKKRSNLDQVKENASQKEEISK